MAITLLEAAKTADPITAIYITEYARQSDILRVLPFEDIEGNAYKYNREDTLPGVGFRGVNEAFSESTGVLNPQTESLCIFGGDLDVDLSIIKTNGLKTRSSQELMKLKALAHDFTDTFINGNSLTNARQFDGLRQRLTGSQLISAGNTAGGDALTLAKLDELQDLVDMPTHFIMSKAMRRRLAQALRSTTVAGYIEFLPDEFGRSALYYNGLPILVADYNSSGVQDSIMPYNEANPGGGTAASTSIYCVSLAESMCTGLQHISGIDVRDLGEIQAKPVMRTRIDWLCSIGVWNGRGAARLNGIKNAPITA
jgi:hypothetical protein